MSPGVTLRSHYLILPAEQKTESQLHTKNSNLQVLGLEALPPQQTAKRKAAQLYTGALATQLYEEKGDERFKCSSRSQRWLDSASDPSPTLTWLGSPSLYLLPARGQLPLLHLNWTYLHPLLYMAG